MQNHNNNTLPIAIIGASYAGLTLANILHIHNIPYVIFDCKSLPFTHVMGGTTFNVPSYEKVIVKKLELDTTTTNTTSRHCNTVEGEGWLTRQDVIESLLHRVQSKLITCTRIVHIEHTSSKGGFYLHSSSRQRQSEQQLQKHSCNTMQHGPYKYIIGADGVLSQVRKLAFQIHISNRRLKMVSR